jgi:transcriptional regulator with XRE-family HTH domain
MAEWNRGPGAGTLDGLIAEIVAESDETAIAYLRQRWLSSAIDALDSARRQSGLTQSELAKLAGTTQSSIARLENDTTGGVSLRRYIDVALACGMAPDALHLRPVSAALAVECSSPPPVGQRHSLDQWVLGSSGNCAVWAGWGGVAPNIQQDWWSLFLARADSWQTTGVSGSSGSVGEFETGGSVRGSSASAEPPRRQYSEQLQRSAA